VGTREGAHHDEPPIEKDVGKTTRPHWSRRKGGFVRSHQDCKGCLVRRNWGYKSEVMNGKVEKREKRRGKKRAQSLLLKFGEGMGKRERKIKRLPERKRKEAETNLRRWSPGTK